MRRIAPSGGARSGTRIALAALAATSLLCLAAGGCGGGGGGGSSSSGTPTASPAPTPTPTPTPGSTPTPVATPPAAETVAPRFTVQWAARSRVVGAPSSALSVTVTLAGAAIGGADAIFTVDRDPTQTAAYSQTYAWPTAVREGSFPLSIVCNSQADGAGTMVAVAKATATIDASATLPNVTLQQAIIQVAIASGQTIAVGQTTDLVVTAYAGASAIVPVTPGSIFLAIPGGSSLLANVGGGATVQGLKPGTASVTATVDGITSGAVSVAVTSNTTVAITPTNPPTLNIGDSLTFAATVTNAPVTSVTWSVLEDTGGGTITQSGVYTAPNTVGTYHVVATSVYDPSHSATVAVTVANGSVTVGAGFPPSGSVTGSVN